MKAFFTSKKGIVITVVLALAIVVGIVIAVIALNGSNKEGENSQESGREVHYKNEDTVEKYEEDGVNIIQSDDMEGADAYSYNGEGTTTSGQQGESTEPGDDTDEQADVEKWGMPF